MQLVAAASLLIASKMEDEVPVSWSKLQKLAGGTFTRDELLQLECEILTTLGFDVEAVTAAEFLGNFVAAWRVTHDLQIGKSVELRDTSVDFDLDVLMRAAWAYAAKPSDEDRRRWNGSWHLATLSLLDAELQERCKPSEIAAAALLLSNRHLRLEDPWGQAIAKVTGYTELSLQPCVAALERLRVSQMSASSRPTSQTAV
jgi:cyclin A